MTLVLVNLTLATDDIIICYCFGIETRTWITLDLVDQMNLLFIIFVIIIIIIIIIIIFKYLSWDVIIWSRSFFNHLI